MNSSKSSVAKVVADYFRKAGIPESMKPEAFWKRLEKKHGNAGRDFGAAVSRRESGQMDVDPYALKNATESLSLDITGQYESKLYRDFSVWLANEYIDPPASILDLGCGNGVLTCLLAALFPAAKIVAVDINARGIEIARALASRLQLSNVDFFAGDIKVLQENFPGKSFDLVVAIKTLFEILDKPNSAEITGHSISSIRASHPNDQNTKILSVICEYLGADSKLICVDRWFTPQSFGWWVRETERAGLRISLDASYMLKTTEAGAPCTFPISVLAPDEKHICPSDDQLLSFYVYPELNDLLNKMIPIKGALAEAVFTSLGDRKIIASFEAIYRNGSGAEATTLFIAGAIAGLYSSWSTGLRQLNLGPAVAIRSMIDPFINRASDLEDACEVIHGEHDYGPLLAQYGIQLAT